MKSSGSSWHWWKSTRNSERKTVLRAGMAGTLRDVQHCGAERRRQFQREEVPGRSLLTRARGTAFTFVLRILSRLQRKEEKIWLKPDWIWGSEKQARDQEWGWGADPASKLRASQPRPCRPSYHPRGTNFSVHTRLLLQTCQRILGLPWLGPNKNTHSIRRLKNCFKVCALRKKKSIPGWIRRESPTEPE